MIGKFKYQKKCDINVCKQETSLYPSTYLRVSSTNATWCQHDIVSRVFYRLYYYMTSSVSGQNEPNRMLWSATRAGKMELHCVHCLLGISRLVPQDQWSFFWCFIPYTVINPLLTKLVLSSRLDIGLVPFFACSWTLTSSRFINTQKRTWPISSRLDLTLGQ